MAKKNMQNQLPWHAVIVKTFGICILVPPSTVITRDPSTSSWITYSKISGVYYLTCIPFHSDLKFWLFEFSYGQTGCLLWSMRCLFCRQTFVWKQWSNSTYCTAEPAEFSTLFSSIAYGDPLLIKFIYYCFCLKINYRKIKLESTLKVLLKSSFVHGEGRLKSAAGFI